MPCTIVEIIQPTHNEITAAQEKVSLYLIDAVTNNKNLHIITVIRFQQYA